jgi:hypothetical protein
MTDNVRSWQCARKARVEAPDPGRDHPEWWARSSRDGGRHHSGITGGFLPESAIGSFRRRYSGFQHVLQLWSPVNSRLESEDIYGMRIRTNDFDVVDGARSRRRIAVR